MGSQELARAVRGSGANPISTTQAAAFEVDNYDEAALLTGSTYPLTADPAEFTVQELIVTENPGGKTLTLTTASGTTVEGVPLGTSLLAMDTLRIDSITINDADGSAGTFSALLIGE